MNERTQNRLSKVPYGASRPPLRVVTPRNAGRPLLTRSINESPGLANQIDASRVTTKEGEDSGDSNSTPPTDSSSDSGSGSSLLDQILHYGSAGYDAYNNYANGGKPAPKVPAVPGTPASYAPAPSSPAWEKYIPWAIGALVLLVIVGVVFKRK